MHKIKKYMLETINYNKVDPVIKWAQNGHNYKVNLIFRKKSLTCEKSCLQYIFDEMPTSQ